MSALAIRQPLRRLSQQDLFAQIAAALGIAAVAAALAWFVGNHWSLRGFAIALTAAASIWFLTTRRTLLALGILAVYLGALDGYLKLASGSHALTFVRDVLVFALAIGVLVRAQARGERLSLPPLSRWVLAFVVLVLVQLFNPQAGSFAHSLAGARQHLEFVPLFFLTFAFVRTKHALRGFLIILLLVAAANGIAGFIQINETPAQFAAWGPGYSERVLGTGDFIAAGRTFYNADTGKGQTRPFGLGSDSGSGGAIALYGIAGALALAALFTRIRYLLFAVVMAIGATTAIVTSQARGAIVASVVILLAYALMVVTSRGRVASVIGVVLAGLVVLFAAHQVVGSVGGSSSLRYEGLNTANVVQTAEKARGRSIAHIPNNLASYPLGAGLGVAGPSASAPGASPLTLSGRVDAETEVSFMTLETGIPGMLVLIGFVITLFATGVQRCRREPDRETRLLLAALVAPLAGALLLFMASAVTAAVPGAPYVWAVGGVISYWLIARPAAERRCAQLAAAGSS